MFLCRCSPIIALVSSASLRLRMRGKRGAHTNCWELGAIDTDHAQLADLSTPPEVEKRETNDTDLLVGDGATSADETSGVLAGTDLRR